MKLQLMAVVAAVFAAAVTGCSTTSEMGSERAFTLATFNIRGPWDRGDLVWSNRMPRVVQVIRDHGFDVFGVQEMVPAALAVLESELPGFAHVGRGRERDARNPYGEGMYIFYRRDRFECLESGTFWLSTRPDEPGSKYPGAGCPRTCTWALLKDRVTGKRFRHFNTHLDHISSKARWDGVQVLLDLGVRPAKKRGETVVLTGDLNETLDNVDDPAVLARMGGPRLSKLVKENHPIALLSTELKDTYGTSATPHTGPYNTFNGWKDAPLSRIDYIFSTPDVRVMSHATLTDKPGGKFASDHYPVAVSVTL